jgi:tRNA (mo5U34)-methyltransferase
MADPIDELTDQELSEIERAHVWVTGTADSKGRVLGRRSALYQIPERRVVIANEMVGLAGKTVVEFGSLEGAHTIALCRAASRVIALEARAENIEKTKVRCRLYGAFPEIVKMDVERETPPEADMYFHSGVLYHLQDPVSHLLTIMGRAKEIVLDTHHAENATDTYMCATNGKSYPCWIYNEPPSGYKAGLSRFSRWLRLTDIVTTLSERFRRVEVARDEIERNGPRATIVATERVES